jgi:dihydrofolate synthase/folylpolyglutamate synthase
MASPSPAPAGAAAYLAARTRFGIKFGLDTIRALVVAMGHPERRYKTLLIAGTNGKGSVAAYVDAALRASGLRVGRYTSPHLVRVNERIVVGGREISSRDLETAVGRVRRTAELLVRDGDLKDHPTYFETLTAAAFEHFRRRRVEVAVLEVGMGGRLDATNVADPLACAIVNVDFDHEAYLGTTLSAIAGEKAGVLRRGRVTVLGPLPPEARAAIARRARGVGARPVDAWAGSRMETRRGQLDLTTPRGSYAGLRPLPGAHQRDNLLVAVRLLEEARAAGLALDLARLPAGIRHVRWPGRLQWIPGHPPLLLDGAHNPGGGRALALHLRSRGPFVLLFGVMADKNVAELARILFPLAREVVLTRPRVGRAASPDEIAARAGAGGRRAHRVPESARALDLARRLAGDKTPVVVAGSLFLVGEVIELLRRERRGR